MLTCSMPLTISGSGIWISCSWSEVLECPLWEVPLRGSTVLQASFIPCPPPPFFCVCVFSLMHSWKLLTWWSELAKRWIVFLGGCMLEEKKEEQWVSQGILWLNFWHEVPMVLHDVVLWLETDPWNVEVVSKGLCMAGWLLGCPCLWSSPLWCVSHHLSQCWHIVRWGASQLLHWWATLIPPRAPPSVWQPWGQCWTILFSRITW